MAITENAPAGAPQAAADDEARVLALCDRLLAELPPRETAPVDFLGRQFDLGLAWVHFPEGYGGLGLSPKLQNTVNETLGRAGAPRAGALNPIGHGMGAPTVVTHGSDEQKDRYLRPLFTNEEIWCQLFSEPGAGSDVAGLSTRAVRDGDEWVVNGQKVWNTGAHFSDWGILIARHDPSLAKHKGLTFFVVDMKSPGIESRPIRQIPGSSEFNEVFLHDVRIPDTNRLGEVGAGWQVAISTLMNERFGSTALEPSVAQVLDLARRVTIDGEPALERGDVRQKLADWYIESQGVRLTYFRSLTALSKGGWPGPEASISKVVSAPNAQEMASFGADLLEMGGVRSGEGEELAGGLLQLGYVSSPAMRVAAGSGEILRNILAERVLGLPGDIRIDRDRPFSEVPTGES